MWFVSMQEILLHRVGNPYQLDGDCEKLLNDWSATDTGDTQGNPDAHGMSDLCAACEETLFVLIDESDAEDSSKALENSESVLDDVELSCGCHFHW